MNYIIPKFILDKVLQYLATRPYSEVFEGIQALQQLQPETKAE